MPIYIGETPVTVYFGETQIQSIAIGETIVNVYTTTTTAP
jgi:hypothetical protein